MKLFGTDGVRGIANEELTAELAYKLGRAGAYVLTNEKHHTPKIIVGTDTRRSADMLEAALTAGLCSVGAEVHLAGVIPTPGIAYLVRKLGFDAGVVISASHNPVQDNGIKFFSSEGYKLSDSLEAKIEDIIENDTELPRPIGEKIGFKRNCSDVESYKNFLISTVDVSFSGLRIGLDCANGATYDVAPQVFAALDAEVFVIHNTPDGTNINKNCGSTHINNLAEYVVENNLDLGLAFDGDGDRMIAVDENGKIIQGDEIMSVCGKFMRDMGTLKKDTIVTTVMSNLGFFLMGRKEKINVVKTAVGDRYVLESMLENGYNLGGEQSGHIIFLDHNTTGDGILTGLQLVSLMVKKRQKLSTLNNVMTVMPQVLINAKVPNDKKNSFMDYPVISQEIKALDERFADSGRVLIRTSGTEPIVRVMIEGPNLDEITQAAEKLAKLIEEATNE